MPKDLAQLSEVEREALLAYRDVLLRYLPTKFRRLIVYGSRVRGDARPDSDLDVVVVVAGHDERTQEGRRLAPFSDPVWQSIMDMACDVSLEHAVYVSPIVLTEDRLNEESPLVKAIQSEGVEVWSRN